MKRLYSASELRNVALNLNPEGHFMGSFMIGSLCFGVIASLLLISPWLKFASFVIGGVLGVVVGGPLFGLYYLKKIDNDFGPGAGDIVVEWMRNAKEGDELDIDKVVARARNNA